jgi:uncharacterized membrane protein affecting hemolysin expression
MTLSKSDKRMMMLLAIIIIFFPGIVLALITIQQPKWVASIERGRNECKKLSPSHRK